MKKKITDEPTTAGIAAFNIVYDLTPKRGPARMRFAPPSAFTVPWIGDVPEKGSDIDFDEFVEEQLHAYAKSLTGKPMISFEWRVESI